MENALSNILNKILNKKSYILAISITGLVLLILPESWLEKIHLKDFMLSYGAWVSIITLFFCILSLLFISYQIFIYILNIISNYCHKKSSKDKQIHKFKNMNIDEKSLLYDLIIKNKQKIELSEIYKLNQMAFGKLLSSNILIQVDNFFEIHDENWALLQKYKKKIFFENNFK